MTMVCGLAPVGLRPNRHASIAPTRGVRGGAVTDAEVWLRLWLCQYRINNRFLYPFFAVKCAFYDHACCAGRIR